MGYGVQASGLGAWGLQLRAKGLGFRIRKVQEMKRFIDRGLQYKPRYMKVCIIGTHTKGSLKDPKDSTGV